MTQVYDAQNVLVPVTVVEAGPCPVVQIKTIESDGYNAVQLGFGAKKAKSMPPRPKPTTPRRPVSNPRPAC